MIFKGVLLFLVTIAVIKSQATPGSNTVNCALAYECQDITSSCGVAGIAYNWTYTYANNTCTVTDCNQLSNNNISVSTNACTSCNTSGSNSSGNNSGQIYANSLFNNCVAIDCNTISSQSQMTLADCATCYGTGYTLNKDSATCSAPVVISTTQSKYTTVSILLLFTAAFLM